MKTIPLTKAQEILQNSAAIIVDNDVVIYGSGDDLNGDDENEFLYLSWSDDMGREYSVKFREGENRSVAVHNSSMFLIDNEGDEVQLTILQPQNLEN
jgi:hypothetical protein